MSSRAGCDYCPFEGAPDIPCAAVLEDSDRWCHAVNPGRAIWTPDAADRLRRRTAELLGRPIPTEDRGVILARRAGKVRLNLGEKLPKRR